MTEFDWSLVAAAAKEWMAEHDTAPKFLLLPFDTNDAIMELAVNIYDTDVRRVEAPKLPRFTDELPPIDHSALFKGPIIDNKLLIGKNDVQVRQERLLEAAKRGELTNANIQQMSMEDYALVRPYLLNRIEQAIRGKSAGEIMKLFKHS